MNKKIGTATQKGSSVSVYDEKGSLLFSKPGILIGFTSSSVTIKSGGSNNTYSATGVRQFSKPAK